MIVGVEFRVSAQKYRVEGRINDLFDGINRFSCADWQSELKRFAPGKNILWFRCDARVI